MDPLSDIFSGMRIEKATYTRLEASAPWGVLTHSESSGVNFILVLGGSGVLQMNQTSDLIALAGGDVLLTFDDRPCRLRDNPQSKITECSEVEKLRVGDVIEIGGGGALTTLLSGFFAMDPLEARPVLSVLPSFLHLRLGQSRSHAFQSVLDLLAAETAHPTIASAALISRFFEALLLYSIRAYATDEANSQTGWLAAMSDRYLRDAVSAIHTSFEENWSLESLAQKARMSRSAFAARFKRVVGQTPMEYLTSWRMHKAAILIRKNDKPLWETAQAVGYSSESAFNRVFKKAMGVPPGEFRRQMREQS